VSGPPEKNRIKPGMYKRAFTWRITDTSKESISDVAASFVRLSATEWVDIIEDYLSITRRRIKNHTAMAKVQLHMIEDLMLAQGAIKRYRTQYDELIAKQGPSESPAPELKLVNNELFLYRAFANAFRIIGDGIAWRVLGFDRAAIRALAGSQVQQQLLDQGAVNELNQFARAFDTGKGFAILNAMTNCLAIGDVTVVTDDGTIAVAEVKSSDAGGGRVQKQKQRMSEASELIKNGRGKLEGHDISIIKYNVPLDNDLAELRRLFEDATKAGYAAAMLNAWSYIEAFDFNALANGRDKWKLYVEERRKKMEPWRSAKDFVTKTNSLDLLSFTPNCAPFSVFPFSDRTCAELIMGSKQYTCHLNVSELGREFERLGWKIEKGPEDLAPGATRMTPLFRLKRGGMFGEVPPADIMRVSMELIRPSVFTRVLDTIFEKGPTGEPSHEYVMNVFEGENGLWI
jgi:hypothetical protein